jgi:hypothetical protein
MLDRARRFLRSGNPGDGAAAEAESKVGAEGGEPQPEGVYAGPGRITHYLLDGHTRTLCGKPPTGLHRWASSWSFVEPGKRCKRCDGLIGDRANERHGAPTYADVALFGVMPPDLSNQQQEAFRVEWERDAARRRGDPPPPVGATFSDPPFLYAKDPFRRHGTLESMYDRVINDVYVRIGKGKKWHRVYETHLPSENPVLAPYGRSFLCPCGNAASDLFQDDDGEFYRLPLRTDVPEPAAICRACAQSDAKHGKLGDLPTDRWDR